MQVGSFGRWQGTTRHLCFDRMTKDQVMVEYGQLADSKPTIDNSLHMAAVWLQLAPAPLAAIAATILLPKLVLPAALLGPSRACSPSAAYMWFSVSSGVAVGQEMRQRLTRTRMTRFVQEKHEDMLVNALRLPRHTISSCFSSHSRRG